MANSILVSNTTMALIKEASGSFGTTPATPAFLNIDYIAGSEPNYTSDTVESQVITASRSSRGVRKTNFRVDGSIKTQLFRDNAIQAFLESGVSGTTASGTLKGSNVDTSLTVEKKMTDGTNSYYRRFTGCQVNKIGLSCEATGTAEISFDLVGMGATTGVAIITGATYAAAASTQKLCGLDLSSFTIGGTSYVARKVDLSVEHSREPQDQFGSASARAIGTSGFRKVKLSVEFYRSDWAPETSMLVDTPQAVAFSIGGVGTGFSFTLPAAVASVPQDSADGSKPLVKVDFMAQFDSTSGTDISIVQL